MGLIHLLFMKGGEFPKANQCNLTDCSCLMNVMFRQSSKESIIKQKEMQITQTLAAITANKFQNKNS